jgi:rhodanese-related sulfurtransferase
MQRLAAGWLVLTVALGLGCRADTTGLETLAVSEAAVLAGGGAAVVFCDANNADTRAKYGTIPGAVLLSSYDGYDPGGELPTGAKLIFYCHSELCGAAATAARRAIAAGRADVAVMPPGIKGWKSAGRPVDRPAAG